MSSNECTCFPMGGFGWGVIICDECEKDIADGKKTTLGHMLSFRDAIHKKDDEMYERLKKTIAR